MKPYYLAFILAVIACGSVLFTLNKYGISWDEPIFFQKGDGYIEWIMNPERTSVNKKWEANSDDIHPPLRPMLAGATRELFYKRLGLLDTTRAYRLSALIFVFPAVFFLTLFAASHYGLFIAAFCGVGLLLTPQIYYLAHIASMDFAISALWFLSIISVCNTRKLTMRHAIFSGILIGLSMLTKFNGLFIFVPVVLYMLVTENRGRITLPAIKLPLIVFVTAFGIFFALWPWLWTDPIEHMIAFLRLQTGHMGPMVWFFNTLYVNGPAYYPVVMFLVSTPLVILVPFFIGLYFIIRHGNTLERFFLLNAWFPFMLLLTIPAAKYDGIRLILPSYPFVILVAGAGIYRLRKLLKPGNRILLSLLVGITVCSSVYDGLVRIHPYQASYYNEIVGGIPGARNIGFETDYWGSPYLRILPWMNSHKQESFCVFPTTNPFYYYLAMGYLEPGVIFNDAPETCDYLVVLMRQGYIHQYPELARIVTTSQSVVSVTVDNVPLVSIFRYPKGNMNIFTQDKSLAR